MRDESLFYLFSSVSRIKGVGDATAKALQRLLPVATALEGSGLPTIRDLLFHLPVGVLDRRFTCPLNTAPDGVIATFVVTVGAHHPPPATHRRSKKPYKIDCSNESGEITLVFFHAQTEYLKQMLPEHSKRVISGRTEHFEFRLQMTHPDVIAPIEKLAEVQKPESVYPLTLGMTSKRIHKMVMGAIEKLPLLPEWIGSELIASHQWPDWKSALTLVHNPETAEALEPDYPARMRLAYDEMLANQLTLALARRKMKQQSGEIIKGNGELTEPLIKNLPFKLTHGQIEVLREICDDMQSGHRMGRLLQGDVGSGKTIVALLAMLRVVEHKHQPALMVPTEIIAQQHFETLSKLTAPLGINVTLLTGSIKGKVRDKVLADIASGKAQIVVGTHALFQEHVNFNQLSLVVIDEQHRFGVNQRMALTAKGNAPHLLHMTATPIPRSLTMTLYGDMDCSLLREKPAERLPITTRVIPLSRYDDIMERLSAALANGEKVYWICPLIEEKYVEGELELTPEGDLAAAETRYHEFKTRFGDIVGLVHGRMKSDVRDIEMRRFSKGETRLLVATTVVEVGVDVRDATIIVIEKAERFGLSQLHQLRGRVGRGSKASACVLLCSDRLGDVSKARLSTLRDSEDGFVIAEADLQIRGGGDLLGSRQSGMSRFIFMTNLFFKNWLEHQELLEYARTEISSFLQSDPNLVSERGKSLQLLLQLFGQ